MKVAYPVTIYKSISGKIEAFQGSMSPTAAKCQYCGELVTTSQIKHGDGRGIVYSLISSEDEKAVVLDRAYHQDCIPH